MRLKTRNVEIGQSCVDNVQHEKLVLARLRMDEALTLLDTYSRSAAAAAAASLDLAMHQLDRELDGR